MIGFSMMTWISFLLGFLSSPIATRLFLPEELAKLNMFSSYGSLISSICYLGLDQAFVRFFREPPGKAGRKSLYTFCSVVPLAFSLLSFLILLPFSGALSSQIAGESDPLVFVQLCIFSFCLVMYRFLSLCYRMEQNARLYTLQGVFYALITKIAYLAVGLRNAEGRAAISSLTVLLALFCLACLWFQRDRFSLDFYREIDRPCVRELASFSLPLLPLSLFSWLNSSANAVMLRNLMGLAENAIYSSALGIAATVNIIQTGFNAYYAPYVMEHYQDDSTRFYTIHRLMACLLTLFGLGVTLLQAPVFLLLGSNYRGSVLFFPFLLLSPVCYCLGETVGMGVTIAKKTHWTTVIYLFSAAVNLLFCFVFIPWLGMTGAALASALSAVLTLLLRALVGEKLYPVLQSGRYLWYTIGLMTAASFVNLWLQAFPLPKYLLLVAILGLSLFLFRRELASLFGVVGEILFSRKKAHGEEKQ